MPDDVLTGIFAEPLPRIGFNDPRGGEAWRRYFEREHRNTGEILSGVTTLNDAIQVNQGLLTDINGQLDAYYAISVDGGGGGSFLKLSDNTAYGSAITLSADEITLQADAVNFGLQTTFDLASETFISTTGTIKARYGSAFGADDDLVLWHGPSSVGYDDETPENGYISLAEDGLYINGFAAGWGANASEAAASNAQVPHGVNRVAYPRGEAGDRAWGEYNPLGLASGMGQVVYLGRVGKLAAATATDADQEYVLQHGGDPEYRTPVTPGERIALAADIESTNASTGSVIVNWVDGSGTYLSSTTIITWSGPQSFVQPFWGFATVPANAAKAYVDFYVISAAAGSMQLSVVDFRIAAVSAQQTVPPEFSPGRTFETAADVTVDNTASAITGQGLLALGNFYEQANDPGSVANGSFWAKTGTEELFIRSGDAWRLVSNLTGGALSMSLSSGSYVGGSGATVYNTATASGGAGGYTYAWTYVSGDALTVTLPSSATTGFSGSSNGDYSVYRCTVTDSAAASVYQDFTLAFIF